VHNTHKFGAENGGWQASAPFSQFGRFVVLIRARVETGKNFIQLTACPVVKKQTPWCIAKGFVYIGKRLPA